MRQKSDAMTQLPSLHYDECIAEILKECCAPNWDGYDAKPITAQASESARAFLERLPAYLPPADVTPGPDGLLSVEWYRMKERTISITVDITGYVHFAAMLGDGRLSGTFPVRDVIPSILLAIIREVVTPFLQGPAGWQ
jgi:hypothetical protein